MDATTMPTIASLIPKFTTTYPQFHFVASDTDKWSPDNETIYYRTDGSPADLLHELAHALLGHDHYDRDVELIGIERDAWQCAKTTLGPLFSVTISDDMVADAMDSYRDWLHARSLCPSCDASGVQTATLYRCLNCDTRWLVNDARTVALRRRQTK
jgi:hypothetical protein